MISAISALWPLLLRALKWAFDLLLGWAVAKSREPTPPEAPPTVPVNPPETPSAPTTTNNPPSEPQQPVLVTSHDDTSAAVAGLAVQNINDAHEAQTQAISAQAAAIDAQSADELASTINNVYQVPSTNKPSGS